jgi:hypothetical protein
VQHRQAQAAARLEVPGVTAPVTTRTNQHGVLLSSATMTLQGDTANGGIKTISGERAPDGTRTIKITGELGPKIARQDMEELFMTAGETGDSAVAGYHRAHLWGAGFGDEAADGIMLAPPSVNLTFQNQSVENALRELRDKAAPGVVLLTATATSHPDGAGRANEPVLAHVTYNFAIRMPNGETKDVAQVDITVPPPPVTNPNVQIKREVSGTEEAAVLLDSLRRGK